MNSPTPQDTWDVIVIGAAAAGENVAQYAIQGSGRSAVMVEKELVGGECSYWACMPSKALLRAPQVLDDARDLPGVQSIVGDHSLDVAAVLARRDKIVNHHDDTSQVSWATSAHIDVVRGVGRLTGVKTLEVTEPDGTVRTLHAREAVVIDTGSTSAVPPVPGLREALPWVSRDVTNLQVVPRRAAIVGGGVVACEAATWMRALGVDELTVIGSAPELLARNEPFAGQLVREHLTAAGVTVHVGATVERVERVGPADTGIGQIHGGEVTVHFSTADGGSGSVTVDELVVATGRAPVSQGIGLESIGLAETVAANHGNIEVDDHLTVKGVDGEWLYAIGDVTGRALLTHMGKYQARIAGAVIGARAEGKPIDGPWFTDSADHDMVPQVTFTEPEVGSVGLTEQQAKDKGIDTEAVEYDLSALAGTYVLRDHYVGRAKLVIDKAADVIVGATFVGPGISDMVHAATIAVVGKVPVPVLWHAVPSYPTPSEIWLRLLETRYNPK